MKIRGETTEKVKRKTERAKGPQFTFRRALPDGMTREEAKQRTLEAVAALAERGGR